MAKVLRPGLVTKVVPAGAVATIWGADGEEAPAALAWGSAVVAMLPTGAGGSTVRLLLARDVRILGPKSAWS